VPAASGYEVRRQYWGLTLTHGRMPLGAALEYGRALGPPGAVGWLDTETTGLAGGTGTYVFLVGIGAVEEGAFMVTQYFLADLAAEAEMLRAVGTHLRRLDAFVTFNGARFDLPLLQTRFLLSRQRELLEERPHLDLLTYARRLWYRPLGGYSLALLEQGVLQVERLLDVPGWLIPSLYVEYLHSGDRSRLEPVFAHNEQDLLSLLALHGVAGEAVAQPERVQITVDWFGLGRILEQRGDADAALRCYEAGRPEESDVRIRRRLALALARHYRRRGERERGRGLWEDELAAGVLPLWEVLERLAMVWEWHLGDPRRALALTERALAYLDLDGDDPRGGARLRRRWDRLARKTAIRASRAGADRALRAARPQPG
jgi:hypothetical protein